MEKLVVEAASKTNYRRAVQELARDGKLPISFHTAHGWVLRTNCDEIDISKRVIGSAPIQTAFVIGIVDWFSRKVLAYNVVNTMDAFHCVETLRMAVDSYGKPEIFNSDQGNQFTSSEFMAELRDHGILISIDGLITSVCRSFASGW